MLLSTAQAALRLGVTPDRIRQLERTNRLRAEWSPLGRLFDERDVDQLAEVRRRRGMQLVEARTAPSVA